MRTALTTGLLAAAVTLSSACATDSSVEIRASERPARASTLPCAEVDQSSVALDVPGPGQPSPEEAVAPYAGALELVAERVGGSTIVAGLRRDGSVFRVFRVTGRSDGWWPDGYAECRV